MSDYPEIPADAMAPEEAPPTGAYAPETPAEPAEEAVPEAPAEAAPTYGPEPAGRRWRRFTDRDVLILTWVVWAVSFLSWAVIATIPEGTGLGQLGSLSLSQLSARRLLIYPDEQLYWRLARGIGTGAGLTVYETPVYYSKIGYSLLMAPLFAIGNAHLRMLLAGLINTAMITSSVFPVRRIARRITSSPTAQLACVAVTGVSPYFALSLTFMTENLFMPMVLWLILAYMTLADRLSEPDRPLWKLLVRAGLTAAFAFASALVKDAGLALTAAFFILCAVLLARRGQSGKVRILTVMAVHGGVLMLCWILKLALLSPVNSYAHQSSIENLNSLYNVEYFLYAIVRTLPHYLLSLMVLPVLWPLTVGRSRLSRANRDRLLFLVIAVVLILVSISYAISVRESLGKELPVIHTRYLTGFLPVFTALMLESMRGEVRRGERHVFLAIALGSALMFCLMGRLEGGTRVFYPDLRFYQDLSTALPVKAKGTKEIAEIAQGPLIFGLGWLLLVMGPMLIFTRLRMRKAAAGVMVAAILCAGLYSDCSLSGSYHGGFITDAKNTQDAAALDDWLRENAAGENVLFIRENWKSYEGTVTDVWLREPFYVTLYADLAKALDKDGRADLTDRALRSGMTKFRDTEDEYYPKGLGFRYVIVGSKAEVDPDCGEQAASFENLKLTVWRLHDPWTLRMDKLGSEYPKADK